MTNCGPGGGGAESCCTSLEVEGGTYYRTYDPPDSNGNPTFAADGGPTGEADPASVSSFRLDKYLVTVGRFRQFVNAVFPSDGGTGWLPSAGSGKHTHLNSGLGLVNVGADDAGVTYERGWLSSDNVNMAPTDTNLTTVCNVPSYATWTSAPGGKEDLPINCVNSYEAYAFCIWDGGFLPSEAEWEYAAAGGSQQREYPWGSTAPGTANEYAIYSDIPTTVDCYYPSTAACTGVANIAPVGTATLGVGRWGQLDMAGEMSEWNLDWYPSPYVDPCTDCAYLTFNAGGGQVFRGGGFCYFAESECLRPPTRNFYPPASRGWFLGFRCARIP
jgi:sulfatase modifying factor 1